MNLTLTILTEKAAADQRYRDGWNRIFGPKKPRKIVDTAKAPVYKLEKKET